MKKTQDYVEAVRSLRAQAGIKMRQPLAQVILTEDLSDEYKQILSEEANVKNVETRHASSLQRLAKNKHWLVKDKILALAFTKVAADEMKERLKKNYGIEIDISTFHALGRSIIEEELGHKPKLIFNGSEKRIYERR